MRIVTWNVNSIGSRLERLVAFLSRHRPDVVCLQELKCEDHKFPLEAVQQAGYDALFYGQKTYNGVALLLRKETVGALPGTVIRGFDDGVDDPAARFIGAKIGGVYVYSLYVPNGQEVGSDKYFYKLNWLARLRRFLDRHHQPEDAIVLGGDYNVAPTDGDIYDPDAWREKILCSTRERDALAEVCAFGFEDAALRLNPKETHFTWWDYRNLSFPRNLGMRIDLFMVSSPVAKNLVSCTVDRDERKGEKPSDHAPVILEVQS